jgi:hypothetical protein
MAMQFQPLASPPSLPPDNLWSHSWKQERERKGTRNWLSIPSHTMPTYVPLSVSYFILDLAVAIGVSVLHECVWLGAEVASKRGGAGIVRHRRG